MEVSHPHPFFILFLVETLGLRYSGGVGVEPPKFKHTIHKPQIILHSKCGADAVKHNRK